MSVTQVGLASSCHASRTKNSQRIYEKHGNLSRQKNCVRPWSSDRSQDPISVFTMPKYVAFLRAINVGGHVVKMDQLRALFEALGFANVETFIASGNVIFDSKSKNVAALERKIDRH